MQALPKIAPAAIGLHSGNVTDALGDLFDGFEGHHAAAGKVAFRVAGQDFVAASSDDGYRGILRQALRPCADPCPNAIPVLIDAGPQLAHPRWTEPHYREREVEAALENSRFRLHFHDTTDFWQVYDRQAGRGLQLMAGPTGYPEWDPGSPLRNFIHWALVGRQAGLVHAGTLGIAGQGVLLAGVGGSGKSGTVLAGLLNGLQSVGDDYVAVTAGDAILAHPAFNVLKQDPGGFARLGLGRTASPAASLNWQGKHVVSFADLGLPTAPESLTLSALCLPTIQHAARTQFQAVAAREAFLALAPTGVTQIPAARAETFRLSAEISRRLPAWRVSLGTDPAEIADAFGRFIESHRA
jgi:hypothetical protein